VLEEVRQAGQADVDARRRLRQAGCTDGTSRSAPWSPATRCSASSSGTPSVSTEINPVLRGDHRHGAEVPGRNLTVSEIIWELSSSPVRVRELHPLLTSDMASTPRDAQHLLPGHRHRAGARRRPDGRQDGHGPYEFRRRFVKLERWRKVIDRAAKEATGASRWTTAPPRDGSTPSTRRAACVVELDCRPETVNRKIRQGRTPPRDKVTYVVDCGLVINPRGVEAQMMGGINDALAMTLTASLHLKDGHFHRGQLGQLFFTRNEHPPEMKIIVIDDSESTSPVGSASSASPTCGDRLRLRQGDRSVRLLPDQPPDPLPFEPYPTSPPIPKSPPTPSIPPSEELTAHTPSAQR